MVQTRSQTKRYKEQKEQQQQIVEEQRQLEEQQIVEEQRQRDDMDKHCKAFGNNRVMIKMWFTETIKNELKEIERVSDPFKKMLIAANIYMKVSIYLPSFVDRNDTCFNLLLTTYKKQYELYNSITKPTTFEELCAANKLIRALQIAQPIIKNLILMTGNYLMDLIVLKDDIQFRLYDVSEILTN
jgi:hypothetical protein